jgi:hypothetical protein
MPHCDAVGVGDRDAHLGVRAGGGELGKVAAKVRVEDTQSVPFAGAVREAKQCGQRESQIRQDRAPPGLSPEGGWCRMTRAAATRTVALRRPAAAGVTWVTVIRVITMVLVKGGIGIWCRLRVRGVGA